MRGDAFFSKNHDRRLLIALLAGLYTLLFSPALLHIQPDTIGVAQQALMVVSSFVYGWAFFFALRASGRLFVALTTLLFALSAVVSYFMWLYRFELSFQQLAVVSETQTQTTLAFLSWRLVLWVSGCTYLGYRAARYARRHERPDPRDARLVFIACVLLVCIFTMETGTLVQRYFPYNLLFATRDFAREKLSIAHADTAKDEPLRYHDTQPVTVVLVVGESVRAANWGLNGYARQTTPLLAARAGVVNFSDVTSCFPLTRVAVPCILTDGHYDQTEAGRRSLIRLFKQMGFFTASIDMHGMSDSIFGSPVSVLLHESDQLDSFNGTLFADNNVDDTGVATLHQLLADQQGNLFVFFHTFGSHWPFDTRYPTRFRQFTPVCNPLHARLLGLAKDMAECDPAGLVNAYDNSILYADHVLDEVIDAVKDRPALVLFTSDHGQSLGEHGLYLHGHADAAMERHVPLVVWASPAFMARHGAAMQRLRAKRGMPITHDAIFHSLPDCIGAIGSAVDSSQSMCH